jgi:hypothetical protein
LRSISTAFPWLSIFALKLVIEFSKDVIFQ